MLVLFVQFRSLDDERQRQIAIERALSERASDELSNLQVHVVIFIYLLKAKEPDRLL